MHCQKCDSDRVIDFSAKCSDCYSATFKDQEHEGYVNLPEELQAYGDYVDMAVCLECGQTQGNFPMDDPVNENED